MGRESLSSKSQRSLNGIEGVNYMRLKRESFAGLQITAENRRQFLNAFAQDYLEENKEKIESGEVDQSVILKEAEEYAKEHINFHNKMFKNYMKGNEFFQWRGKRERVLTQEYLSRMQNFLKDMEEKYLAENTGEEE